MTPYSAQRYLRTVANSEVPLTRKATRRTVLAITTLLPVVVAGCTALGIPTPTGTTTLGQVQSVFQDLDDGLHVLAATFQSNAALQTAVTDFHTFNMAVQSLTPGATTSKQIIQEALNVLGAIAPVITAIDPQIGVAIEAVVVIASAFLNSGLVNLTARQSSALAHLRTIAAHRH